MSKVYVDAGHGGRDVGAVKYVVERDVNLTIALACRDYLVANGVTVKMSRTSNATNTSLNAICNECNAWGADLAVSIHNNAGGGDGFEVYHAMGSTRGIALARNIEAEVKAIGQNSRGLKTRKNSRGTDYYGFNRLIHCPSIICEGFFVDNPTDVQIADTIAEQQAFGVAYAKGILKTLGSTVSNTPTAVVASTNSKPSSGYSRTQFIKDIQSVTGSRVDGICGSETIGNTITVSAKKNRTHSVVKFIQMRLNSLGFNCGKVDGIAGVLFTSALKSFQRKYGCVQDGEATAKCRTWVKLLTV